MNRILEVEHYWDGPLGGTCEYEGRRYRFKTFNAGGWWCEDKCGALYETPRIFQLLENDKVVGAVFENELRRGSP